MSTSEASPFFQGVSHRHNNRRLMAQTTKQPHKGQNEVHGDMTVHVTRGITESSPGRCTMREGSIGRVHA